MQRQKLEHQTPNCGKDFKCSIFPLVHGRLYIFKSTDLLISTYKYTPFWSCLIMLKSSYLWTFWVLALAAMERFAHSKGRAWDISWLHTCIWLRAAVYHFCVTSIISVFKSIGCYWCFCYHVVPLGRQQACKDMYW